MSQCTDVDSVLARLEAKIDAQNKEVAALRKAITTVTGKGYNDKELRERIDKIEKYINQLDTDSKQIANMFVQLGNVFERIFKVFGEVGK